jgi:ACT domain-containing protein
LPVFRNDVAGQFLEVSRPTQAGVGLSVVSISRSRDRERGKPP